MKYLKPKSVIIKFELSDIFCASEVVGTGIYDYDGGFNKNNPALSRGNNGELSQWGRDADVDEEDFIW